MHPVVVYDEFICVEGPVNASRCVMQCVMNSLAW